MSKTYAFLELLEKYIVKIPIIQRDYALGRENTRINQVRQDFVTRLRLVIEDDNNPLNLGFIYGSVSEKQELILLDGQQRMTTLFLFHWYLACRARKLKNVSSCLENFSYEIRPSSQQFCEQLVKEFKWPEKLYKNSLLETIKEQPWFFQSWVFDPSIKGMLVVLDAMHEAFKKTNFPNLWEKLVSEGNQPITFQFFDIEQHGIADELYIKMNSRGKQLTDYENFKAWLQKELPVPNTNDESNWHQSMDIEWTDFFWSIRGDKKEIDDAFLRYFKAVSLNAYVQGFNRSNVESNDDKETVDFRKNIERLHKDDEYIPVAEYGEAVFRLTDEQTIHAAFDMLNALSEMGKKGLKEALKNVPFFIDGEEGGESLILQLAKAKKGYTYMQRVLLHGLFLYLTDNCEQVKRESWNELGQWMRVVRNLALNTDVSLYVFVRSINSLTNLYDNCKSNHDGSIINCLADKPKIEGFRPMQVEEEIRKANLIRNEKNGWREAIIEYENLHFLSGQVGFLLDFAQEDLDRFNNYAKKFKDHICDDTGKLKKDNDYLLQRALYAKGNYLLKGNAFCKDRDEWKDYFRSEKTKINILNDLLDDLGNDHSLEDIKMDFCTNNRESWKKLLICEPYCWQDSSSKRIDIYSDEQVYLLFGTDKRGRYAELRSYYVWKKFIEKIKADYSICYYHNGRGGRREICVGNEQSGLKLFYDGMFKLSFWDDRSENVVPEWFANMGSLQPDEITLTLSSTPNIDVTEQAKLAATEFRNYLTQLPRQQANG